jgi:hypothetical protein
MASNRVSFVLSNAKQPIVVLLLGASGLVALACHKGNETAEDVSMDLPPLAQSTGTKGPDVHYPDSLKAKTPNPELNTFIEEALQICSKGDYDRFRQLFGSNYTPTPRENFERIWKDVQSVEVISVHPDGKEPPNNYAVHVVVQLRKPDNRQKTRRDAVLAVFRENDRWRMGPTSREIWHKVLIADSQPAEGTTRPATASSPD